MKTVLITGANRGIGLAFVQQYLAKNWRVFACCRDPEAAQDLQRMKKQHQGLTLVKLDVSDEQQIQQLGKQFVDEKIDVFINNAGIAGDTGVIIGGTIHWDNFNQVFAVNTIAPVKLVEAFLPALTNSEAKTIAIISSSMGSIGENESGGRYAYRASKAALNAIMKSVAIDLKDRGIKVLLLHPGWVKTRLGGEKAPITPEESVSGMIKLIESKTLADSGSFLRYNNTKVAW